MHIMVTGSSGFVGGHLVPFLLNKGYQVTGIARNAPADIDKHPAFRFIEADGSQPGAWQDAVQEADAVINLAGVNIFRRWNDEAKKQIYNSRILTTRNLVAALPEGKPVTLSSTSAVGFYGDCGEQVVDESAPPGDDFLARLAVDWEQEAKTAEKKGARVVLARLGIVLGKEGGALASMLPVFRMCAGGPLGSGRQWFPWVHMDDVVAAHHFVIENPEAAGPINFTAPEPVRNLELARTLGRVIGRPAFLKVPGFVLRTVAGEFGEMLLNGQRAIPQKLMNMGFEFKHTQLEAALRACLK